MEDVSVLVDALDFTTIHPWTQNNPPQPFRSNVPLFADKEYSAPSLLSVRRMTVGTHHVCKIGTRSLRATALKACRDQGLKASEAAYMAFQGPSLPSSAEAAIAHKAGCSLVGTASLYALLLPFYDTSCLSLSGLSLVWQCSSVWVAIK